MVHLLLDDSSAVQKMSYTMLQRAVEKRTGYLVVEAGVDMSEETKFELPSELLQVVQNSLTLDGEKSVCAPCGELNTTSPSFPESFRVPLGLDVGFRPTFLVWSGSQNPKVVASPHYLTRTQKLAFSNGKDTQPCINQRS